MTEAPTYIVDAARNVAIDILRRETSRTPERIREVASHAAMMMKRMNPDADLDVDALTAELRHQFSVAIDDATVLDDCDPAGHVHWLLDRKADIRWRFWARYMIYLEREFGMAPSVVNATDDLTDKVLSRLENPLRNGPWDRRGMVVGSVQSGKTANYTGLICKAVDSGYKLVIVLAGIHSNLRAQTQLRIDEGVLGFDTQKSRRLNPDNQWIGVGRYMRAGEFLHIHSLTSSAEDGDFSRRVADNAGIMLGSDPVVLVIKKNSGVLKNLLAWVRRVSATDDDRTGSKIVRNVPLLLIDDEADNASINTRAADDGGGDSVTAINGRIRELLALFDKAAYVGYTATPFANIFVNPDAQTQQHGDDIFPRSFIVNVKPPTNYVGPTRVFGIAGDPDAGIAGEDALPIIREIDDSGDTDCFPQGHKKTHVPSRLPESLKKAIRCFIIACAARRARGQRHKHNSMLIHVTRFVDVQGHVQKLVQDELMPMQRRLQFGDGDRSPALIEELRSLWEAEFVPTSTKLGEDAGDWLEWTQVESELNQAAQRIRVTSINGFAQDALDYKTHEKEGLSVIAIGGDKLSRGLTLEGLSVSYFLRTSRMYDTLMQMGRWFGYRPGYLDLCRLFTTGQLVRRYRHIALAEVELRREFDYMVATGRTPMDYGLRVRTHPDGMLVTALNKMCHSQVLDVSWAGTLVQTTHLPKDKERIEANFNATVVFLGNLGDPVPHKHLASRRWIGVPAAMVSGFLDALQYPQESARAVGRQVVAFIRKQATKSPPELTEWTVVLLSSTKARSRRPFLDGELGLVERSPESQTSDSYALKKANIISPDDQAMDLSDMEATDAVLDELPDPLKTEIAELGKRTWKSLAELALQLTRLRVRNGRLRGNKDKDADVANGKVVRELRPKSHGLLLIYPLLPPERIGQEGEGGTNTGLDGTGSPVIGLALSFPSSDTAEGVEYRVNRVWNSDLAEDASYED